MKSCHAREQFQTRSRRLRAVLVIAINGLVGCDVIYLKTKHTAQLHAFSKGLKARSELLVYSNIFRHSGRFVLLVATFPLSTCTERQR